MTTTAAYNYTTTSSAPFSDVSRRTYSAPGFHVEADDNSGTGGQVRITDRDGNFTHIGFDHPNPLDAAQSLSALVVSAVQQEAAKAAHLAAVDALATAAALIEAKITDLRIAARNSRDAATLLSKADGLAIALSLIGTPPASLDDAARTLHAMQAAALRAKYDALDDAALAANTEAGR